jgi:hypothetical protein
MEAIAIGVLGLILGFAFGALNLYYILEVVRRDIAGLRLDYSHPDADDRHDGAVICGGLRRRHLAGGIGGARLARGGAGV